MEQEIDLDKIAEFMNSEPEKEIDEVDKKEVENTLEYIDTQLANVKEQTKAITTPEEVEVQEHSIEDLTFDQLQAIEKKRLVSFQVVSKNNEILSFEDVFDEYIKSNLHHLEVDEAADSLLESITAK